MTTLLTVALAAVVAGVWLHAWSARRGAKDRRRRIERPNSYYASAAVRDLEDRERWGRIDVARLHPLNREEVRRLLARADADGVRALTSRDRLFLDTMALLAGGGGAAAGWPAGAPSL